MGDPSPISYCALIGTTWILSSGFLRALMLSENRGDVWFVGTKGQDGVWSVRLVKHSRTDTESQPLPTHLSSLDRTHRG